MSKIGNEAKLIRTLFEERVDAKVKKYEDDAVDHEKNNDIKKASELRGRAAGLVEAKNFLNSIHLDLESK